MDIKEIFSTNGLLIQKDPHACGPCTLLNILRLKGDPSHTEPELTERCHTKPPLGTSNESMITIAQEIGLEVIEQKPNAVLADLEHHIDSGNYVVVCYQHLYSGEGHYGLITQHDDEALYFRDCSYGFFRLKKKYFTKFWYNSDGVQRWFMAVT